MDACEVTVAVATCGPDAAWPHLARTRALPSARAQGVDVVYAHHPSSLAAARNMALDEIETAHAVFLDADDELEPGYVTALAAGSADVRAPAVRYVHDTALAGAIPPPPRMPRVAGHNHPCVAECLLYGNWLVIGSWVDTALLRRVGGWRDYPWSEDWATWLACHQAGATFEAVPAAVYRAYVRRTSRNRGASPEIRLAAHRAIALDAGLPAEYVPALPTAVGS